MRAYIYKKIRIFPRFSKIRDLNEKIENFVQVQVSVLKLTTIQFAFLKAFIAKGIKLDVK